MKSTTAPTSRGGRPLLRPRHGRPAGRRSPGRHHQLGRPPQRPAGMPWCRPRCRLLEAPDPQHAGPEVESYVHGAIDDARIGGSSACPAAASHRGAARVGFDQGGQAVVLFNRRGYATGVQCEDCGGAYRCPSCGIGLVLHQKQRTLMCHYCGFHRPHSGQCPSCGALGSPSRGEARSKWRSCSVRFSPDTHRAHGC